MESPYECDIKSLGWIHHGVRFLVNILVGDMYWGFGSLQHKRIKTLSSITISRRYLRKQWSILSDISLTKDPSKIQFDEGWVTSHRYKWCPLPTNDVDRITQHIREGEVTDWVKDGARSRTYDQIRLILLYKYNLLLTYLPPFSLIAAFLMLCLLDILAFFL